MKGSEPLSGLFFHSRLIATPARAWLLCALYILLLFAVDPFLPAVADWLRVHGFLPLVLVGGFLLPFLYVSAYLLVVRRIRALTPYALFAVSVTLALAVTWSGREPAEHVHLFEYAAMALLLQAALKSHFQDHWAFISAFVLAVGVGYADEFWQGLLPMRECSLRDVFDNGVGALLGLTCLAIVNYWGGPRRQKFSDFISN